MSKACANIILWAIVLNYRNENDNRKANLDEVNKWIRDENEKRMAEAEALRAKLEREKQELRDFLEQGN